jgi:hypothetical protein
MSFLLALLRSLAAASLLGLTAQVLALMVMWRRRP